MRHRFCLCIWLHLCLGYSVRKCFTHQHSELFSEWHTFCLWQRLWLQHYEPQRQSHAYLQWLRHSLALAVCFFLGYSVRKCFLHQHTELFSEWHTLCLGQCF